METYEGQTGINPGCSKSNHLVRMKQGRQGRTGQVGETMIEQSGQVERGRHLDGQSAGE